ncbi:hydroxyacyl-Coenzyme A dehydrogenase [Capsaspora owczarzaki ATCC 30864]|uniref:3-hydroxyacyl-CoA dehydrogenase n=1 Tax=Capsaspora owczarzaki (strain ATCC 30864) TaxID=595528 RepID=A0A0D2WRL9_CAPO3|nr:hydroxyacyl-Coenzyme A dehydrogenase [Capsaspora owczarzaki ATCC 30864]KJE93928.1 hydroxyacyl-Coenzyme A dehydrogenase [Capsaspora owczarzaki ATCC 30864]|eukprot:XP_004347391.1 hydroxyacyl-Coenzyme A dehydrogenase [Capsaspora owczarzaki ATCC 30864]
MLSAVSRASAVRAFSSLAARAEAQHPIKNVTIFGAGFMGAGIAQVSAEAGYNVKLVDVSSAAAEKGVAGIKSNVARDARKKFAELAKTSAEQAAESERKHVEAIVGRIQATDKLESAVAEADLVIEAIVENIKVKQDLFRKLDAHAPKHAILASNTSSLRVTDIASATNRRDRVGGLHFFSPVPVMKLVEIVRTDDTSNDTHAALLDFGKSVKKVTVSCKDTPGFVVNRLLVPLMLEAIRMLERGDASKEDIDAAMKFGANHPMGPLELGDFVGLDVCHSIIEGWHQSYPDVQLFNPSPLLTKLVSEKKFGRKTGEGFYVYPPAAPKPAKK